MGIFSKRDHRHSDPRVRLQVVEKLDDQEALVEVACEDDSPRVRMAAVARVVGDQGLAKIAKDAKEIDVRLAAVERISSQQLLAEIIKARKNYQLMGACFARITNREILQAIAEDTGYNPTARRMAVEQFADESYLSDLTQKDEGSEEETAKEVDVEALMEMYGGVRMVRAIGRFRRSEKALRALGKVAHKGGEAGELAVEYLCRALGSTNPDLEACATEELITLSDPDLVACLVRAMDKPSRLGPIRKVLQRIETPEAREALEQMPEPGSE
jgi:hypothetical protein